MKPGGDDSDWKFVSASSKNLRLVHYKCTILVHDNLCVHKVNRKVDTRLSEIELSM